MEVPKKRPFVSLKGLETGRVTSAGKPVYKYKGEEISEKSIDIEADGKIYVIPTVIDGKLYTEEAAVAKFFNKEVEPIKVLKENIKERSKKLAYGGVTTQNQMRNIMSRMEEKDKAGVPKEDFETARDIATDSIPGVSETKDIISLGSNIGKGDYVGAGIDATSLALGAVPVVGDIARKGFKSLVAKDIKKATEFLKDTNLIDKWKKDKPNPKQQKRNPDVEKAANELLDGKITGKQYRSVVKENMPIRKINEVPEIPTFTEIVGSLTSDKSKKGILGLNKKIEDGTR